MVSVGAVLLGMLWGTVGGDAFVPIFANVYINGQGRSIGSGFSSGTPQTVCSWYNIPGVMNAAAAQNAAANSGSSGWGGMWLNGKGTNAGSNGLASAGLPGLLGVLNGVYASSMAGAMAPPGRQSGVVVRVQSTKPGVTGTTTDPNVAAAVAGNADTRELDYYDGDSPYYYGDNYYYGPDYTYSDPNGYTDTVVYYDTAPQAATVPSLSNILQTIYGSQFGTANTAGSDPCSVCAASMLNMLMG